MKKFCKSLREYAVKIINFKKKNMELSKKEMQELCETTKIYYIWKEKIYYKNLKRNIWKIKNITML